MTDDERHAHWKEQQRLAALTSDDIDAVQEVYLRRWRANRNAWGRRRTDRNNQPVKEKSQERR